MLETQGGASQRSPSLPLQCSQFKIRGQDWVSDMQMGCGFWGMNTEEKVCEVSSPLDVLKQVYRIHHDDWFGLLGKVFLGYLGIRKASRAGQQDARRKSLSLSLLQVQGGASHRGPGRAARYELGEGNTRTKATEAYD